MVATQRNKVNNPTAKYQGSLSLGIVTCLEPGLIEGVDLPMPNGKKHLIISISVYCLDSVLDPSQLLRPSDSSKRDTRPDMISSGSLGGGLIQDLGIVHLEVIRPPLTIGRNVRGSLLGRHFL